MRTTAFLNLKGGVAKTATTVNTAAILARDYGRRVLVIDADSQCNTTEFFQVDSIHPATLADALNGREAMIEKSTFPGVSILPASDELMDLDLTAMAGGKIDTDCVRKICREHGDSFDHVLIDCPPAFNAASAAALLAADEVIIPIKLDAFSLRGMSNLMRQIANMRKINAKLVLAGILPTMYYKSKEIDDAEAMLRKQLPTFPHIRRSDKVDGMTFEGAPLIISSPISGACVDYRKFVKEWLEG